MITQAIDYSLARVERRRAVRAIKMGEGAWREFLTAVERDPSVRRSFSPERRTYKGYAIELDLAAADAVIIAVEED